MTCEEVRLSMGAHALGALDPEEALEIDDHLATCGICGTELLELEGVASFLGKVSERDVELVARPPRQVLDRLLNARAKRHRRGRLLLTAAASVAILAVGGTVWTVTRQPVYQQAESAAAAPQPSAAAKKAPVSPQEDGTTSLYDARAKATEPYAPTPSPTMRAASGRVFSGENKIKDYYAMVSAAAQGEGTELQVRVKNVPIGMTCSLVVYGDGNRRDVTESWTIRPDTYRSGVFFIRQTSLPMRDIDRFEVIDRGGRVLINVPVRK